MAVIESIFDFAARRPGTYFGICIAAGFVARLAMAHGDWALFFNPMFPLLNR